MSEGVMLVRRLDSFCRYSIQKTESNLRMESASSCELKGISRAKACSTRTRVLLPVESKRGNICTRLKSRMGATEGTYFRSTSKVLSMNDGWPPMPIERGRKPLTKRVVEVEATSPREFTAVAKGSVT